MDDADNENSLSETQGFEDEKIELGVDKTERLTRIPISRVKTIMKTDPDITIASQEAVYLITKATELFIECLSAEAFSITSQNKKKTLQKKDVDLAIEQVDAMTFLEGALE